MSDTSKMDDKILILLGEIKANQENLGAAIKSVREDLRHHEGRVSSIEAKLNMAAGVVLAASTALSVLITYVTKKIGGA